MIIKCKITRIGENNVVFVVKLTWKAHLVGIKLHQKDYVAVDVDVWAIIFNVIAGTKEMGWWCKYQ